MPLPSYDQDVPTPESSRFSVTGLVAILAGVAGVLLLTMAVVRLAGMLGDQTDQAPTLPAATSAAGAATTSTTMASTTPASAVVDPKQLAAVTDDSGSILVSVPVEWGDISGSGWVVDGEQLGPAVTAAPNIDAWYSTWTTPGAFVGVSTTGSLPEIGDFSGICTEGKIDERSAGVLSGAVHAWSRCGDDGSDFYVFVGGPTDASYAVLVQLVSTDASGLGTLEQLLATFSYLP